VSIVDQAQRERELMFDADQRVVLARSISMNAGTGAYTASVCSLDSRDARNDDRLKSKVDRDTGVDEVEGTWD
jgi:hypothetical protein